MAGGALILETDKEDFGVFESSPRKGCVIKSLIF